MKKALFIVLYLCLCVTNSHAGEYSNLTPGVSTKKDADKEFRTSVSSTENGKRLDYSTAGHDLKRLSVVLKDDGATIQSIDLFFEEPYMKSQVVKWFDLNEEAKKAYDISGNLIEYYEKIGIQIYFEGTEESAGVFILRYMDIPEQKIVKKKVIEKKNVSKQMAGCPEAARTYYQDSESYFDNDQYNKAAPLLNKASLCDPDNALYSTMLAYSYWQLGEHRKAIKAAKHSINIENDHEAYSLLGVLYWENKDCHSAIPYFEKAIATERNKKKNKNLELLGACYYKEGRLNEALNTLVKSNKRNSKSPLTVYFLAAVSDRSGNKSDAKVFYKRYLRLKHDDKDMNFMAKERLSVLQKKSNSELKKKTSLMTQEIIKTIFGNGN